MPILTTASSSSSLCIDELSGLLSFVQGLHQSPEESVEKMTSWFHGFLWTFSLGIAQLSKYNCHMLCCVCCWHPGEHSHGSGLWLCWLCSSRLQVSVQKTTRIYLYSRAKYAIFYKSSIWRVVMVDLGNAFIAYCQVVFETFHSLLVELELTDVFFHLFQVQTGFLHLIVRHC